MMRGQKGGGRALPQAERLREFPVDEGTEGQPCCGATATREWCLPAR